MIFSALFGFIFITAFCGKSLFADKYTRKQSTCPCVISPDTHPVKPHGKQQHLLCIDGEADVRKFFNLLPSKSLNLNYRMIEDDFEDYDLGLSASADKFSTVGCDVVMKVVQTARVVKTRNERCPGLCKAIPFVLVPLSFLESVLNFESNTFFMCSLNLTTAYNKEKTSNRHISLGQVLRTIATRRLQECEENKNPLLGTWDYISSNISSNTTVNHAADCVGQSFCKSVAQKYLRSKRSVYGVIIWVGSLSRIDVALNQAAVLRLQDKDIDDSKRIVGWVATEDVYPCGQERKQCTPSVLKNGEGSYMPSLPATVNHLYSTSFGWICGQRRPLRAVSHVLRLYNPDFLIVADDDTFVNVTMLAYGTVLSSYILTTMSTQNYVIGDMRLWHITRKGFFYGGGGYLIGKPVLNSLVSNVIHDKNEKDKFRSKRQAADLGVLREAERLSNASCPKCLKMRPSLDMGNESDKYAIADLKVRVVDLCVNMMAQSGSCYHSDHSMTRCLSHAVYADTLSAGCKGMKIPLSDGNESTLFMCYEGLGCDPATSLTCHRHMANPTNPALTPLYNPKSGKKNQDYEIFSKY
jgi:hypothetical protein